MRKLTPKEKRELEEIFRANPQLRKQSEIDRKKYGEEKLIKMNQELMRQLEKEAKERYERSRISEDDLPEIERKLKEEAKPILKGRHSVYIEKNPLKND